MIPQNIKILQGLFIVFIALAGNFISETMGCKIRKTFIKIYDIKACITIYNCIHNSWI